MKRTAEQKRTIEQNKKLWVVLSEVAAQATLNGEHYDNTEWKLLFLSALNREMRQELRIVRGIYGEPVNLGRSTKNLSVELFSALIEIIHALGTELGVVFKDPRSPPVEAYAMENA